MNATDTDTAPTLKCAHCGAFDDLSDPKAKGKSRFDVRVSVFNYHHIRTEEGDVEVESHVSHTYEPEGKRPDDAKLWCDSCGNSSDLPDGFWDHAEWSC